MDRYLCFVIAEWVSIFLFANSTKVECFCNENFLYMSDCLLCPMPMTYDMMTSMQETVQLSWNTSSISLNKNRTEGRFATTAFQLPSEGVYSSLRIDCPSTSINSRITFNTESDLVYFITWEIKTGSNTYKSDEQSLRHPLKNGTTYADIPVEAFHMQFNDLSNFGSSASIAIFAEVHSVFMSSLNFNWYVNSAGSSQVKLTWYR